MLDQTLRIATRKSPLALAQASWVKMKLKQHYPSLNTELIPMCTSGDRLLQHDIFSKLGGKGLFLKELEHALLHDQADIAVHSMKDVPLSFPEGLGLAAITERETPYDALVSFKPYTSLNTLPLGAKIGTSSLRRQAQLRRIRPDLDIIPLRGNVGTRLEALKTQRVDALVLAAAGLKRLQLDDTIQMILTTDIMLPACGQGALGIEYRLNDHAIWELLQPLQHPQDARCVIAERKVSRFLGAHCHAPVAIHAYHDSLHTITITAQVYSLDGQQCLSETVRGSSQDIELLAKHCADQLRYLGAHELLHATNT